jgi:hypothetical protein
MGMDDDAKPATGMIHCECDHGWYEHQRNNRSVRPWDSEALMGANNGENEKGRQSADRDLSPPHTHGTRGDFPQTPK